MSNIEVRLRVDSELKENAENVFNSMGMTISEAIRVFLTQSVNSDGLPFRPHLKKPSQTSIQAFSEVENGKYTDLSIEEFSQYIQKVDNEDD